MARTIADSITRGPLDNIQSLANGSFGAANPLQQVTGEAYGAIGQERLGLQHTDTMPVCGSRTVRDRPQRRPDHRHQ